MKHYVRLLTGRYIALSVIVVCLLGACSNDYSRTLPNGYKLIRSGPHEVWIAYDKPPWTGVIPANIDGYSVTGDMVVGHVSILEKPPVPGYEVVGGYFILDTKNDEVFQGLEKDEWFERLKGYGINEEPELKRSTGFDKNY